MQFVCPLIPRYAFLKYDTNNNYSSGYSTLQFLRLNIIDAGMLRVCCGYVAGMLRVCCGMLRVCCGYVTGM